MSGHKRFFKNYLINKPFQTRMSYYFVSLSLALVGVMMFTMNTHILDIRIILANIPSLPITSQLELDAKLNALIMTALAFLLISVVGAILYGIVISHRIAGPMYAILKYIDQLRSGKYEETRNLRPYDELLPIMESLHELAQELKKQR